MALLASFSTPGPDTFNATITGQVEVRVWGAGGGGGSGNALGITWGGGGGGGGAYASRIVSVANGLSYPLTVGGGGAGGLILGNAKGSNGQDSSFGTGSNLVLAKGGIGGDGAGVPGEGGAAAQSVGSTRVSGFDGESVVGSGGSRGGAGGAGGGASGGAGGAGGSGSTPTNAGVAGSAPGGGGGGGRSLNNGDGGAGGHGRVEIHTYDGPAVSIGFHQPTYDSPIIDDWEADHAGQVLVEAVGSGGGGRGGNGLQGAGAGGGGGAYARSLIDVVPGDVLSVYVYPGGSGGSYNQSNNSAGQATVVRKNGTIVVQAAGGGAGGSSNSVGQGGSVANSIGDILVAGGNGGPGTTNGGPGGYGGPELGGDGGAGGDASSNSGGQPGGSPGGGGGGGDYQTSAGTGGAGAAGMVRLSYYETYGFVTVEGKPNPIVRVSHWKDGVLHDLKGFRVKSDTKITLGKYAPALSVLEPQMPSYIPEEWWPRYDVNTGAFNFNSGNTSRLQNSLLNANSANANWFWFGDSFGEGWTELSGPFGIPTQLKADWTGAAPYKMRDAICTELGIPVGGTGYVRAKSVMGQSNSQWSGSKNWNGPGHYVYTSNNSATFTSHNAGTAVRVYAKDSVGQMRVSIDGVVVGTTAGGNTGHPIAAEWTGLPNTKHVVKIDRVSNQRIELRGAEVFTPTGGLRVHNLSQGGSRVMGTDQPAWEATAAGYDNMLPCYVNPAQNLGSDPHVLFLELGGNDLQGSGPWNYQGIGDGLDFIGSQFPNSDKIIVMLHQGPPGHWQASVPDYWSVLLNLAIDKDWALWDMQQVTRGYAAFAANGFQGDVYGHPNSAGHAFLGNALAQAILRNTGFIEDE